METNRPTVGTILTIPAHATRYRAVPGFPAPLGHEIRDGMIWHSAELVEVIRVRKVRGGFKVGVRNESGTCFALRLGAGWEATYDVHEIA